MKCLVTGSNGFVGSWLVRELLQHGHQVHAMCRKTSNTSLLDGLACEFVYGDMHDRDSLRSLVSDVEVVYHCAAALGARSQEAFDRINAQGVQNLVEAIKTDNPNLKRLVLVSSIAAGGPSDRGTPRLESQEPAPVSQYGLSKLRGEEEARKIEDTAIELVVVRPPIVYGPAAWSIVPLVRSVKWGIMSEPGGEERRFSYIHVKDLVTGIRLAGTVPEAAGEVIHLVGPQDDTFLAFQKIIARVLNKKAFSIRPGPTLMKTIGWCADRFQSITGQNQPFGMDKVREALAPSWVASPQKAEDILGYRGKIDLQQGVIDMVADFQERKWI